MTLWMIIRNSLRQHALSTGITAVSIGLGCGLLMAVWVVNFQTQRAFKNVTGGFDAILGPRGSQLQLVLNSLFHMDSSPGLIKAEDYQTFRKRDQRYYERAVPIAVGDNYKGYRIVGTTHDLFEAEHSPGQKYELLMGEQFIQNEKQWNKEAVIGATVAVRLNLNINKTFHPYHGLNFCQGTVSEMLDDPGKEIFDVIRWFGEREKIFNVHFRNIAGRKLGFEETFPDEGDIDMLEAARVYKEVGYDGMIMPDHAPRISGENADTVAFAYCYGYIRAVLQSIGELKD